MRLFVALSIPADVRENLAALIERLRQAYAKPRWIPPENLHITLKFIGEVESQKLPAILDALVTIRIERPLQLDLCNVGFFPNAGRPSVAWIGIVSPPTLALLAAEVNRVLVPVGIRPETKPFVPHLTIARFKEIRLSPALRAEIETWKDHNFGVVSAGEIHLVESRLKSSGAEYTTLRSFPFVPKDSQA